MVETITGGCLCGAVRFEYKGAAEPAGYCHCSDCRHVTGSAFNISLPMEKSLFTIVAGAPKGFSKRADSGNELTRYFCPDCGSPLYGDSPVHPQILYIKAGALDEPGLVRPDHQSWMRSRVSWAAIPDGLPAHSRGSRDA